MNSAIIERTTNNTFEVNAGLDLKNNTQKENEAIIDAFLADVRSQALQQIKNIKALKLSSSSVGLRFVGNAFGGASGELGSVD